MQFYVAHKHPFPKQSLFALVNHSVPHPAL